MSVMRFVRGVRAAGSLRWPVGFAGICTDLSVTGLRAAYASGLYPVCAIGLPALCRARERMVLFIENFHLEPAVRRRLRMKEFEFSLDRDFNAVIAACAADRPNRMSRELVEAFIAAHDAGIAHSVEVRDRSGALVGGIFGFAIGRVFFTEGQFAKARDAGKAGFAVLNCHLQRWGYLLNDAYLFYRNDVVIASMLSIGLLGFLSDRLVVLVLTLVLAALTKTFIEDRFRTPQWGRPIYKPFVLGAVGMAIVIGLLARERRTRPTGPTGRARIGLPARKRSRSTARMRALA